jgi:hypothetical protein
MGRARSIYGGEEQRIWYSDGNAVNIGTHIM